MATSCFIMRPLEKYLNEHLSGSSAALDLLSALEEKNSPEAAAYRALQIEINRNRLILKNLIQQAGFGRSKAMEYFAKGAAGMALWRFKHHGLQTGHLGLAEALEALELGVHGQMLLWRTLAEEPIASLFTMEVDFQQLIRSAEHQKVKVEALRMSAVRSVFCTPSVPTPSGMGPLVASP